MGLADELPDEAIEAFKSALLTEEQRRRTGTAVTQLRVTDEAQLREAIAAAVGKVSIVTLLSAGEAQRSAERVFGLVLEDPLPPEGWRPEGALVLVAAHVASKRHMFLRTAGELALWEMVGMLECASDAIRAKRREG